MILVCRMICGITLAARYRLITKICCMTLQKKKTMVLGASTSPARYSYLAVNRLRAGQHPVIAIGKKTGQVADIPILTDHPYFDDVHTVTLYLNANNQKQ